MCDLPLPFISHWLFIYMCGVLFCLFIHDFTCNCFPNMIFVFFIVTVTYCMYCALQKWREKKMLAVVSEKKIRNGIQFTTKMFVGTYNPLPTHPLPTPLPFAPNFFPLFKIDLWAHSYFFNGPRPSASLPFERIFIPAFPP